MDAARLAPVDRLISKSELRHILGGVSNMTIHRHLQAKRLPQPIRLPGMHPRWRESEVLQALGLQQP